MPEITIEENSIFCKQSNIKDEFNELFTRFRYQSGSHTTRLMKENIYAEFEDFFKRWGIKNIRYKIEFYDNGIEIQTMDIESVLIIKGILALDSTNDKLAIKFGI